MFVLLMFYIPVNKFSVMSGRFPVYLGKTSAKQSMFKCLAQGHNTEPPVSLQLEIQLIPNLTLYHLSHFASLIMHLYMRYTVTNI